MNKAILMGLAAGTMVIGACGAAKWREPPSWTLRADGRLRAANRKEDFSFAQWKEKYLAKEGKDFGLCLAPSGAKAISDELAKRDAEIIALKNQLSECR